MTAGRVAVVADDSATMRRLLRLMLEPAGWQVVEAGDGEGAVEAVRRERPEVVLLDWTMPGLGGVDACRRIRADAAVGGVAIVMLSGHGEGHRPEAIAAGADGFLTKPFPMEDLFDEVARVVDASGEDAGPAA